MVDIKETKNSHGDRLYVAYRDGKVIGMSRYWNDLCHLLEPCHPYYAVNA